MTEELQAKSGSDVFGGPGLAIERTERWLLVFTLLVGVVAVAVALTGDLRAEIAALGPALIVYALTTRLPSAYPKLCGRIPLQFRPCWGVRRHPWIDLILALLLGYVGYRLSLHLGAPPHAPWVVLLASLLVVGLGIYVVTVAVNPRSAVVVINFSKDGEIVFSKNDKIEPRNAEIRMAKNGLVGSPNDLKYPLAWPLIFVAKRGGSVVWHLNGPRGYKVSLKFDSNRCLPFGDDLELEGTAPGAIAAGPTVRGGCARYKIIVYDPSGKKVCEEDPLGDIPPGNGH